MRIQFIAADLEENLGVGILVSIAESLGHEVTVIPFNAARQTSGVVQRVMKQPPDLVGLSIQFQHRAPEFVRLARELRGAGFDGHVTAGGQFSTLAWRETLAAGNGVDSIVLHDGEETIVDLIAGLEGGSGLDAIAGLALSDNDGVAYRTDARRLLEDLDKAPFAKRYRAHNHHMGIPFIPIIGGRGCWGKCNYCSIIAFYDDAIESGGGRAVRFRSPENIAQEMALLLDKADGRGIFCFHDDNFVFPSEKFSLKRIRKIREELDTYEAGRVAMVGKARPDCITPKLAKELAALGVIRMYIGVENGSQRGGDHLRRGTQQEHVSGALKACRDAGIFNCYNLLIFEPDVAVDDVRDNVQFIRDHSDHPVNFCRAEPYYGTALHLDLSKYQDLGGSYLGFNYRIADDRCELAYRICSAAFRGRNFAPQGIANRYMGLGYAANILRRFYDRDGNAEVFWRRAIKLTRAISLDTADYLARAVDIAEKHIGNADTVERKTALLGLEIAAADTHWHRELDELYGDMEAFATEPPPVVEERHTPNPRLSKLATRVALGVSMAASMAMSCGDEVVTSSSTGAGGPGAGGPVDPAPGGFGGMGGEDGGGGMGGEPLGGFPVDPAPGGMGGMGGEGGMGGMGMLLDGESPGLLKHLPIIGQPVHSVAKTAAKVKLKLIDQWFDTSPKAPVRSEDLPLFKPPRIALVGHKDGDRGIAVSLRGVTEAITTRWEGDGAIDGKGERVRWYPEGDDDRICVAVRSHGGICVLALRAKEATVVA